MADAPAVAVRVLRVALLAGVAAAVAGVVLDSLVQVPQPWSPGHTLGELFRGLAIGIVIGAPFLVLVLIAALERRSRLGWYAAATLLVALVGILLAT